MYKGDNYRIPYKDLDSVFMNLFKNEAYEDMAQNFEKYFEAQDVTYSSDVDSLNMVVDRDRDSFTEEQYDKVVEFCKKNNVNLYVSNPSFELWLYMHFDEIQKELNQDASVKTHFKVGLILHDSDDKETRKQIIKDFKKNMTVDILIVFNMLLTGFDAPRLKRLYFGRKLKDVAR